MMDQQEHSVVTRWGGRAERYREFRGAQVRAHDPFAVRPVQFGQEFHFEAWVLDRFAPDTQSITSKPTTVTAAIGDAQVLRAKATFVVTRRSGALRYVLVTRSDPPKKALRELRRVARANNAEVEHRTLDEVRGRIDDFWFFERLRQAATLWVRQGSELDAQIVSLCASGRRTWTEMFALLDVPKDLVKARLARLHVDGLIVLDREGGEPGATARVGAAP